MSTAFDGFPATGITFLNELAKRDKAWFQNNRKTYEAGLAGPAKAFVERLGEELHASIGPNIIAIPRANGSIAPINNDIRFSKNKTPYKDHLLFRFWEGENKKFAPTLYVRLSAHEVGFASGAIFDDVAQWRNLIDDDGSGRSLNKLIQRLKKRYALDVAGQTLKRVPAPYASDHPRADLLRHKMIQLRFSEPLPSSHSKPAFCDWCMRRLDALADVHHWFVQHL